MADRAQGSVSFTPIVTASLKPNLPSENTEIAVLAMPSNTRLVSSLNIYSGKKSPCSNRKKNPCSGFRFPGKFT